MHVVAAAVMLGIALLSGCSTTYVPEPAASPADPFSPPAQCERDGGRWHADKNFCEYQSPGLPVR